MEDRSQKVQTEPEIQTTDFADIADAHGKERRQRFQHAPLSVKIRVIRG
jgi:hypothetical protein